MSRLLPWKRDPRTEALLAEERKLISEYYKAFPGPEEPQPGVAEIICFLIPAGIILSPLVLAGVVKEAWDDRMRPTEQIRSTVDYWRGKVQGIPEWRRKELGWR